MDNLLKQIVQFHSYSHEIQQYILTTAMHNYLSIDPNDRSWTLLLHRADLKTSINSLLSGQLATVVIPKIKANQFHSISLTDWMELLIPCSTCSCGIRHSIPYTISNAYIGLGGFDIVCYSCNDIVMCIRYCNTCNRKHFTISHGISLDYSNTTCYECSSLYIDAVCDSCTVKTPVWYTSLKTTQRIYCQCGIQLANKSICSCGTHFFNIRSHNASHRLCTQCTKLNEEF